jgi:hypothetical protein
VREAAQTKPDFSFLPGAFIICTVGMLIRWTQKEHIAGMLTFYICAKCNLPCYDSSSRIYDNIHMSATHAVDNVRLHVRKAYASQYKCLVTNSSSSLKIKWILASPSREFCAAVSGTVLVLLVCTYT